MTDDVTIYHIPCEHIKRAGGMGTGKCINIIDTPGFGDTRGLDQDDRITAMVANLLKSFTSLDYILMVVKASETRLTASSSYVFSRIQALYATDISERVLGMFTFSDGQVPNAYAAVEQAGIHMQERFRFNNSAMWQSDDSPMTS